MGLAEEERIEVLHDWVRRMFTKPSPKTAVERRQTQRIPADTKIILTPVDSVTLLPLIESKVFAVTKDHSQGGFGILTDMILPGEVFFAEVNNASQIYLVRRARRRRIRDNIFEYGMQILDSYDSFDELKGT